MSTYYAPSTYYNVQKMAIHRTGGKYSAPILICYTIFFWLSGLALIFIGLWTQLDPRRNYILRLVHLSEREPLLIWSAVICVVAGVITLIIGFVACCAAIKRLRCMLAMFMVFLVLLFIADIAIASLAVAYKDQFTVKNLKVYLTNMTTNRYGRDAWVAPLLDTIQFYITTNSTLAGKLRTVMKKDYGVRLETNQRNAELTALIDRLQFYGQCCGTLDAKDWSGSRWQSHVDGANSGEALLTEVVDDGVLFPESCCRQISGASALNPVARSMARCQRMEATSQWRYSTQQCCGGTGARDYKDSFWYITNSLRGTRSFVPPSCCVQSQAARSWSIQPVDPMCTTYFYDSQPFNSSVNNVGCYEKLHSWLEEMTYIFMGVGFSFAALQVVGLIISLILCNNIRYYTFIKDDY